MYLADLHPLPVSIVLCDRGGRVVESVNDLEPGLIGVSGWKMKWWGARRDVRL